MITKKIRKLILFLLLPLSALLLYVSSYISGVVENVYSKGIYRIAARGLSLVTGIFPFSVVEILLAALVIFALWRLAVRIFKLIRQRSIKKNTALKMITRVVMMAAILYFAFVIMWGFNYSRLPFSDISGLEVKPASVSELAALCDTLAQKANELRNRVDEDSRGVMALYDSRYGALKRASMGYEKTSELYPELGGRYGRPKGIMLSSLMSYTGIAGVYSPFTAEANVNMSMPDCMIPNTACHEMAHQRGFAREDEANYISYLTCMSHPDIDFRYSGILLALIHATNALYDNSPGDYAKVRAKYSDGVVRDLTDMNKFWEKYEGPVEKISEGVNNVYLKANMQSDGVKSYGRMVDLLIAEYMK